MCSYSQNISGKKIGLIGHIRSEVGKLVFYCAWQTYVFWHRHCVTDLIMGTLVKSEKEMEFYAK